MATLARSQTGDVRNRVEDYLDDRIQTVADLENVNELLAKVREQQELLKQQLVHAKTDSGDAERKVREHTQALTERAQHFQQNQADIDHRLQALTQSNVSDDAVKIFESRMTKLRRIEIAEGYVEILKDVGLLTGKARGNLKSDANSALASYTQLRALLQSLQVAQPAAEGAAPHMIDEVERETNTLYLELKTTVETSFHVTLERMLWPKKELKLLGTIVQDWTDQAGQLLDLQAPDLLKGMTDRATTNITEPIVLLPLQVMVKPLSQRFQYHFYGERPTNRLDKPEYFFSHILDLVEQHSSFVNRILQPLLDEKAQRSSDLEMVYPDAISCFITALLPIVLAKCLSLIPNISNQPQLLSHFIHEMMSFDSNLRDSWAYSPVPGSYVDWRGLTWDILNTHGYFNAWLETEKEFALSRYKKIRDSAESGNIEYEGFESGSSKPTKGAVRVNDLLETITDRYRGLSSFSQKMKFLMDVQLAIFDDYHSHLHGALQAYLVGSHTAGRLIQGQTEADAGGLKGLDTLCKIFGSAEYLERKMSDWSEDLFFLELWEELQGRARQNSSNGVVGQDLTVEAVAARTSSTIRQTDEPFLSEEGGALFDETAATYRRLRERSEAEIVRSLETSVRNAIRPLTKVSIWSSLSPPPSDISTLPTSSALDSLLNTLSSLLEFLAKVIARTSLRRITRQLCLSLQREIYDNVILRNTFSAAGAAQLKRDIIALEDTIDSTINIPGEARRNMKKVEDALSILNLQVKASSSERAAKMADDADIDTDDWGFEGDDAEETTSTHAPNKTELVPTVSNIDDEGDPWGLWEAEKAIFASNESARHALADMGLEFISESEARVLIRRRIEINS